MAFRDQLPQSSGRVFITDGGMETTLIFGHGFDLPCFASFPLLREVDGRRALRAYFQPYVEIAREHDVGLILDTVTWRASVDWGAQLGFSPEDVDEVNRDAVLLMEEIRAKSEAAGIPILINGCVGPRGDAYSPAELMTAAEAEQYHSRQIGVLSETAVDMIGGLTITYAEEAVGIARAARTVAIPVVISFTVETDGRLPSGQSLRNAIEQVDGETDGSVAYFMVNCAYPTHFADVLEDGAAWTSRIRGVRANASSKSHAELDDSVELDDGDPEMLAAEFQALQRVLPNMNVVGGCCGTDHRHIAAICRARLATT